MSRSFIQHLWDFIGIPFRFILFDQKWLPLFAWTTLEEERLAAVFPVIQGNLLDIGAGTNNLVRQYGNGIGVDVYDWGNDVLVVENSSELPFESAYFDTITLIACLNHIPYRQSVLVEAFRLLKPGGKLVITMINPFLGKVGHLVWWYSEDKKRGGMKPGEVGGLAKNDILNLCHAAGFHFKKHAKFLYGLNNLYIFEK